MEKKLVMKRKRLREILGAILIYFVYVDFNKIINYIHAAKCSEIKEHHELEHSVQSFPFVLLFL